MENNDFKTVDDIQYHLDKQQYIANRELSTSLFLSLKMNKPIFLEGEPGVGKTAIAEGIGIKIIENQVPENLKNSRLLSLDLSSMLAGAKFRGEFEERLKNLLSEISDIGNIILFIDEIHTIIGTGANEGSLDVANIIFTNIVIWIDKIFSNFRSIV